MKCLITGITGTLGTEVTRQLKEAAHNHSIVGYSRDEFKQVTFPFRDQVTLYLGDIRNRDRLIEASRDVQVLFHFAALKHVDKLESNPEEAVATNVYGTMNVLHAQRVNKITKVVLSATDKGVYPINTYGMTKGLSERLVLRNPNNVVCRYGNVLASRGSVISKLVESLKKEGKVYLTDPNMTRFWISQKEAAAFVIASAFSGVGGLKIPVMKAATLTDIARVVADLLNVNSWGTVQIGVRPGEKTHECLRTSYEGEEIHSHTTQPFTDQELRTLLKPIIEELCRS